MITRTVLARSLAYLSSHISDWAGMLLEHEAAGEVEPDAIERFTNSMRTRLDFIGSVAECAEPADQRLIAGEEVQGLADWLRMEAQLIRYGSVGATDPDALDKAAAALDATLTTASQPGANVIPFVRRGT